MNAQDTEKHIEIIQLPAFHGGAWKVAYADFVTAMMAFFLLLWLLNVTTDEQKNAISNYFDPTHPTISEAASGAGGVLGGLSMTPQGAQATNRQNISLPQPARLGSSAQNSKESDQKTNKPAKNAVEKAKETLRKKEEEDFKKTERAINQAIQEDPELATLSKNLMVDVTPEGLRIQIVDQEGASMFAIGSARMYAKTKKLMTKVAELMKPLPNEISVRGHTDSIPYGPGADYTNWELSTDRANASRRVLLEGGLSQERLNNVVGKADTEHLHPDKPADPRNRRISIILLKEELTNPDGFEQRAEETAIESKLDAEEANEAADQPSDFNEDGDYEPQQIVPIGTFRHTPGQVEFP